MPGSPRGGRRPLPNDLKLLSKPTGTALQDKSSIGRLVGGHAALVTVDALKGDVPECPSSIPVKTIGRTYWRLYWKAAGNWLAQADLPVVVRLCELHNLAATIRQAIDEDDVILGAERLDRKVVVQETPDGPVTKNKKEGRPRVAHPMLVDYDRVLMRIERIEDRLGLNPTERSRIRIQVKESESALDRWQRSGSATGTG